MTRMIGSLAAAAVLAALALPGSATADTKRADGLTTGKAQITEMSSQRRRWHRHRYRYRHARRWHRPRVVYRGYPRRYYGYPYAYSPYYSYGPSVRFRGPGFSFGFGY